MIQIEQIKRFFPPFLQDNPVYYKYMLKEYIQLMILEYLSNKSYVEKLSFIGGTNLRLIKGIDRFSEDLDFDCKDLSKEEFYEITNDVVVYLKRNGYRVEIRDKNDNKLKAFRRNIYFPEFLFDLGLSGHREERFLIKIDSQDQQIEYPREIRNIKGCGLFFPFPVPPDEVLTAMKVSAMLSRQKGRDFYDTIFLLSQSVPDFDFLNEKSGIKNMDELKHAVYTMLQIVDLDKKTKDFEHLLFNKKNSKRILYFKEFIESL